MGYKQITLENVLKNKKRRKILKFIKRREKEQKEDPYFSQIKRRVGLENGVTQYHLNMLEKLELTKKEKVGKYARYTTINPERYKKDKRGLEKS